MRQTEFISRELPLHNPTHKNRIENATNRQEDVGRRIGYKRKHIEVTKYFDMRPNIEGQDGTNT